MPKKNEIERPAKWAGKLTRKEAIAILHGMTDKDDPAWEWAVEDYYDEDADTMPSVYDVFAALGVTPQELDEAAGISSANEPNPAAGSTLKENE